MSKRNRFIALTDNEDVETLSRHALRVKAAPARRAAASVVLTAR
jgi:hypothetical protein